MQELQSILLLLPNQVTSKKSVFVFTNEECIYKQM